MEAAIHRVVKNWPWLKISTVHSPEGLTLQLQLRPFGCPVKRGNPLENIPMLDGERRSRSEDEMVRQPHQLSGRESEQTLGDGETEELMYCFGG